MARASRPCSPAWPAYWVPTPARRASTQGRCCAGALPRMKALAAGGRLVIASIHDLTLAARHADRIVALKAGRVVADGPTREVLTAALLKEVFEVEARITDTDQGPLVDLLAPL